MGLEEVYLRNLEHKGHRSGWLRAAVLGVNDGLVSVASLLIGVAVASKSFDNVQSILISTGAAGIAAGALSMAVGEYISVSSQTDIEESDRLLEIEHLAIDPEGELEELVEIYKERGLDENLARLVAVQLTEKDALNTHLRDELGHHPHSKAHPIQASIASAISFALGGFVPFLAVFAPSVGKISLSILIFTMVGLTCAGVVGARIAGSRVLIPTLRVLVGGCLGMAITAGIGQIFHATVA
jgi:VIT1/CCC1 family predicted Fe2+/Mn2+ transporter